MRIFYSWQYTIRRSNRFVGRKLGQISDFDQFGEPDPDCLDFFKSNVLDSNNQIDALDITELKISNQTINPNSVVTGGSSSSTASGNVYNYHFGSNQNFF